MVGGVSLGGLISRYALALLESRGEPHNTHTYVSIDTPHEGAYTSLGVQWFVQSLLPIAPALAGFEALLDSPAQPADDAVLAQGRRHGRHQPPARADAA